MTRPDPASIQKERERAQPSPSGERGHSPATTSHVGLGSWEFDVGEDGHINGPCSSTTKFPNPVGALQTTRLHGPHLTHGPG